MSCGPRAGFAELGKVKVSADKLLGAQTQRSLGNDIARLRPRNQVDSFIARKPERSVLNLAEKCCSLWLPRIQFIFLTNSWIRVMPVATLEGRSLGPRSIGPKLAAELANRREADE